MKRLTVAAAAALVLASALSFAPPLVQVAAAAEELRLEAASRYVVDPKAGAVHVTIEVTATNLKRSTVSGNVITSYYYRDLSFGVHVEAAALGARDGRGTLRVSRESEDGYDVATVRLRSNLNYRQTARFTISYDLPGGAPRSAGDIRVGQAFVSLYAFAVGDPGRSSVRIELPAGFEVELLGEPLEETTEGTTKVLTATAIADPLEWWAVVTADRVAGFTTSHLALGDGDTILIRAWPEDPEWQERARDTLRRGMPVLRGLVGLDWPVDGELVVTEVHAAALEGYAGIYDTRTDTIEISEQIDELTIVHEASHAWFNDDLFESRWITEGLADEYAGRVLLELKVRFQAPTAPSPNDPGEVALNSWRFPGRIDDEETDAREQYGYNASWYVVRGIVVEIGEDAMRDVMRAAANDRIAYLGAAAPERVAKGDDWRRFLDLVEERGGSERAAGLLESLVLTAAQADLLDERAAARQAYDDLEAAAGDWRPPYVVRHEMSDWHFDDARDIIEEALLILAARERLEGAADGLGLELPSDLADAWNAAEEDFGAATEAASELTAALDDLAGARTALDAEPDPITALGLIGETPEVAWSEATTSFESGDFDAADASTDELIATLEGADDAGRARLAGVGAALAAALAVLALVLRRRRRAAPPPAVVALPVEPAVAPSGAPEPYATLPAEEPGPSSPVEPSEPSDAVRTAEGDHPPEA